MNEKVIPIDHARNENINSTGKYYAEDDDGNRTGPYTSQRAAIEALERRYHLLELHLIVRELADLFDRWERGEAVESEILEYATTKQAPGWPVIVF